VITSEFEFFAPESLDEALALLGSGDEDVKVLSGGMSLVPMMRLGLVHPQKIVSLNRVQGMDLIEIRDDALFIGATARHARIATHGEIAARVPVLSMAASAIGDVQIRHRGTIGGSLAHADPAADYPTAMTALGARFHLRSADAQRTLTAESFFLDVMTTALAPEELLVGIEIPLPPAGSGYAHERLRRVEGAYPIVLATALIQPDRSSARLALGGVAGCPYLLELESAHLDGGDTALASIAQRAREAASGAQADLNGSAEYRQAMAGVYARRAVSAALGRL